MRFCGHCGTPVAAAPPAPDVSQTLRSFVAEPVAEALVEVGGELPEERRLITALFADVSGFTALARSARRTSDPPMKQSAREELAARLDNRERRPLVAAVERETRDDLAAEVRRERKGWRTGFEPGGGE